MSDLEKLKQVVDSLITNKPEEAEIAFKPYIEDLVRTKLGLNPAPVADEITDIDLNKIAGVEDLTKK